MRTSSSCSWRAAEHFGSSGLSASAIEKDYYVTEALRLIAGAYGPRVIFKGGTSLSKGWGLIQRFSEDIDIFLDPEAYTPKLGKRPIDRELEKLRDVVAAHPGLTLVAADSKKIGGIGRDDYFAYPQLFPGALRPRVLLEAGTASGRQPTEDLQLESYAPAFLRETGQLRRRRGRGSVHDAAAPFPAHLRREALHDPRQDRAVPQERQAPRHLR